MTSRERVRLALAHKQPDRVPMDLWGSSCRLHTDLYEKIAEYCGLENLGPKLRPGTTTEYVDYRLSDMVNVDFRHINIGKPDGYQSWKNEKGESIDEWGIGRTRMGPFNEITHFPLAETSIQALQNHKWPTPSDPGRIRGLREQAEDWHKNTGYAITATSAVSGLFFENAQYLCGPEEFLMAMYTEPEFVHALMDKLTELFVEWHLYYLDPIAEYIEWIEFTEDLGTQQSLFCSPDMIREFLRKPHQILFGEIKKRYKHLKIFYHTCGSIEPIIPELVEWGVDILNPLQPLAAGMDLNRIKKEWGNQLIFHGAIDVQRAPIGTKQELEQEVKTRIDQLAEGGGYILAPCNHLQIDTPAENFFTLYNTAKEYGQEFYSK